MSAAPPVHWEQEGALERWLKSEEPPADNKGPVRVLTGKTFEEEVFKSGRDTFIKVGAGPGPGRLLGACQVACLEECSRAARGP